MYMASKKGSNNKDSAWMKTQEEAIRWAQANIQGDWIIYKEGFVRHDIVYKNH